MSKFDDLLKSKSVGKDPAPLPAPPLQQRPQPVPPNLGQSPRVPRHGKPDVSIRSFLPPKVVACLVMMVMLLGFSLLGNLLLYKKAQDVQQQIRALRHDEVRRQDLGALQGELGALQGERESLHSTVERLAHTINPLSGELNRLDDDLRDLLSKVQRAEVSGTKNGPKADSTKGEGRTESAR